MPTLLSHTARSAWQAATALALCWVLAACSSSVVEPEFNHPDRFAAWSDASPEYRLGPGDEISVVLPYNTELNYTGTIGPDGRFVMPIGGAFPAANETADELQAAIDRKLAGIVLVPNATVVIKKYAQGVYVGGQVRHPGLIPIQGRMDLLAAITVAGGMHDTARKNEIIVIRRGADGKPMLRTVNLQSFLQTASTDQNLILQPLDIVYVPKSSISEVNQWIDQFINQVLPFNRSFSYTISNDRYSSP